MRGLTNGNSEADRGKRNTNERAQLMRCPAVLRAHPVKLGVFKLFLFSVEHCFKTPRSVREVHISFMCKFFVTFISRSGLYRLWVPQQKERRHAFHVCQLASNLPWTSFVDFATRISAQ